MEIVISLNQITKQFKKQTAVNNISTVIHKGELVAILGPNGAGKSTTLLMMLGLIEPTNGEITLMGDHPKHKRNRERVGAMLQEVSMIDALTVMEVIQLFRSYYPQPMAFEQLISITGLQEEDLKKRADKLSGGQKRRLSFALALAGDPEIIFFDEPTVGMDTSARRNFWRTVEEMNKKGKTVIFTTHYLQEADDVAKRIILFNQGKIIADGAPIDIKRKLTASSVSFAANDFISLEMLTTIAYVTKVVEKDGRVFLETDHTDEVLEEIFARKIKVKDINIHHGRLDEAFEQLTRRGGEFVESSLDAV